MTRRRCVQTLSLPEESCLLGLSTPGARFTTEQLLFPRAQTPHRTYFVTSSRPCVNKSRLRGRIGNPVAVYTLRRVRLPRIVVARVVRGQAPMGGVRSFRISLRAKTGSRILKAHCTAHLRFESWETEDFLASFKKLHNPPLSSTTLLSGLL